MHLIPILTNAINTSFTPNILQYIKGFYMYRLFLLCCISLFFTACSNSMLYDYSSSKKELKFKIDEQNYIKTPLNNALFANTFDGCTNDSYTINESRYFIEHISLHSNCRWNGLSGGFFEYQFKEKLKLKSMETLERIEINNYTFSTFNINNESVLNIIWLYGAYQDTFIIDYEGKLFNQLITALKPDYKNKYIHQTRFKSDYKQSLVNMNFIKSYFGADREVWTK